jgi:hypothetical protein
MKPKTIPLALVVLLLLATAALAQGGYSLSRWTVDGGGRTFSEASGYALGGTIGQPDTGALSGGGYVLAGGFWHSGVMGIQHRIWLPTILRGS